MAYPAMRKPLAMMKSAAFCALAALSTAVAARADFSYITSRKTTGGTMAAMAGGAADGISKTYLKGQKLRSDNGETATIIDFDAQTITTINGRQKTVSVKSFNDIAAGKPNDVTATISVKETGAKKTVNGFDASELVMTMDMDSPEMRQMGKLQMEIDMWLSKDVPGAGELRAFYRKNMEKFPWAALSGGAGNQGMQAGMANLQHKIAEMDGVQVLQVVKIKAAGSAAGAPAMPQMTPEQSAKMADAMAKLQAMQKQGGPGAAIAAQAMARMGGVQSGAAASSNSMIEMTLESSGFSSDPIADSVFAIPVDYKRN
jgi:hypothetical protein